MLSSFFSDITDHGIKPSFSFLLSNSIDQTCSNTIQPQITWFPLKLSVMESQPQWGALLPFHRPKKREFPRLKYEQMYGTHAKQKGASHASPCTQQPSFEQSF